MQSEKYPTLQPTILVVDDAPDMLSLLGSILKQNYHVKIAKNGNKAVEIAKSEEKPDLILLDIMMPEMDGHEVCRILKDDPETKDIPIIFLTAKADIADEELGLELGAVDYITKPISPPIVLARVKTHLHLKAAADFLKDKNAYLEQVITKRTEEINAIQDVMLFGLTSLAETRDVETGNHIRRTQNYIKILAEKLKDHPRFKNILTEPYTKMLFSRA